MEETVEDSFPSFIIQNLFSLHWQIFLGLSAVGNWMPSPAECFIHSLEGEMVSTLWFARWPPGPWLMAAMAMGIPFSKSVMCPDALELCDHKMTAGPQRRSLVLQIVFERLRQGQGADVPQALSAQG